METTTKIYGHTKRMEHTRLTNKTVEFNENQSIAKIETIIRICAIKDDLKRHVKSN